MPVIGEFEVAQREADPDAEPTQIKFCGELFTVAAEVGSLPFMRFAHAIVSKDTRELQVFAAAYELLRECIAGEDWARFEALAVKHKAGYQDLARVSNAIYIWATSRPTKRPSDSSAGPQPTTATSKPDSSSPDTAPASAARPDLAVPMVDVEDLIAS